MNAIQVRRQAFLREAGGFFENASLHAGQGNLQTSASLILKALDQERTDLKNVVLYPYI